MRDTDAWEGAFPELQQLLSGVCKLGANRANPSGRTALERISHCQPGFNEAF
jgi:hypothetical protein